MLVLVPGHGGRRYRFQIEDGGGGSRARRGGRHRAPQQVVWYAAPPTTATYLSIRRRAGGPARMCCMWTRYRSRSSSPAKRPQHLYRRRSGACWRTRYRRRMAGMARRTPARAIAARRPRRGMRMPPVVLQFSADRHYRLDLAVPQNVSPPITRGSTARIPTTRATPPNHADRTDRGVDRICSCARRAAIWRPRSTAMPARSIRLRLRYWREDDAGGWCRPWCRSTRNTRAD